MPRRIVPYHGDIADQLRKAWWRHLQFLDDPPALDWAVSLLTRLATGPTPGDVHAFQTVGRRRTREDLEALVRAVERGDRAALTEAVNALHAPAILALANGWLPALLRGELLSSDPASSDGLAAYIRLTAATVRVRSPKGGRPANRFAHGVARIVVHYVEAMDLPFDERQGVLIPLVADVFRILRVRASASGVVKALLKRQ